MVLALAVMLGGCAQPGLPPVAERSARLGAPPDRYVVRPGDTLYSIAWRFGLEHRALARANGIGPPYTIYGGQQIRLLERAPAAPAPRPGTPAPPVSRPRVDATRVASLDHDWRPPTDAPVARGFGNGNKGIDYRLSAGHAVHAVAAGEVVYAGSGLGGFRHLVIVKHDPIHLSAYSVDGAIAVAEGERIKAGAILADKQGRDRTAGTLHFEIRKDGEPIDPGSLISRGR